ncbi:hypothetical protein FOL46_000797 [Perkinsus olseni]|uniref:Uncharacterized protein n=1 Tax=Perkinsus olseni TaxID=32597 RepID=A0A7J6KW36_PEROL|nr:hypothetical protein FOL46_000797 [Perkinsus olseni]
MGAVAPTLSLYDSTNLDSPCLPEADPPPPVADLPPDVVVPMVFLVVKACVHPILLGSDFLAHYRMAVVYRELGPPLLQGVLKDRPNPAVTDAGRGYSVSATRWKNEPLKVPTRIIESFSELQKKRISARIWLCRLSFLLKAFVALVRSRRLLVVLSKDPPRKTLLTEPRLPAITAEKAECQAQTPKGPKEKGSQEGPKSRPLRLTVALVNRHVICPTALD